MISQRKGYQKVPNRDFFNDDNGPLNSNFRNPENQNDDVGRRSVSNPSWSGHNSDFMQTKQLYQKCYDLMKWLYPTLNKFPKSQRLIFSQRVETLTLSILGISIRLNYGDSKVVRRNAILELHKLSTLLRLSKDLSWLSIKQYEFVSKLISEIFSILKENDHENLQQFV